MDSDTGKEIEVDPDPDRGLKWIRPNAVEPGRSGSETLPISEAINKLQALELRNYNGVS